MKSTWFSKRSHYEFMQLLDKGANNGVRQYETFDAFCDIVSNTLRQSVNMMQTNQLDDAIEEEVKRVQRRWPKWQAFREALAFLTDAMQHDHDTGGYTDFLGETYQEIGISSDWHGQFFTPVHICNLLAKMNFVKSAWNMLDSTPRILINDPACGAGALILASANELNKQEIAPHYWWAEVIDIDIRCVRMAYIQLSLAGVPGIVYHGNTLGPESGRERKGWITLVGAMFPLRPAHLINIRNGQESNTGI
jgi:type I restriction-modification system DNA methylase subunit